jgi:hypothetical protein
MQDAVNTISYRTRHEWDSWSQSQSRSQAPEPLPHPGFISVLNILSRVSRLTSPSWKPKYQTLYHRHLDICEIAAGLPKAAAAHTAASFEATPCKTHQSVGGPQAKWERGVRSEREFDLEVDLGPVV